ncbi:LuxR C-terminal-related transcriptional regulator [Sphingomonas sp. H39-1-10]|uniref:helix-turn-helix transcriptional regulator n=1 Tax=Sphingomonas pollutisoli TaxID=3030829 RepID=UPI0023B8A2F1|nr:LuxR C-terminal-related transcriptional regulator [Sphingomonas pollutisoli]MDF0490368.1 LuxR C-terminal-related transcriptional regulator [Sphingomonas pollutisoli]
MAGGQALERIAGDRGTAAGAIEAGSAGIADAIDELLGISSCGTADDLRTWLRRFARGLGFYGCRYIHLGHVLSGMKLEDSPPPVRFLSTSARDDFGPDGDNWALCDPVVSRIKLSFTPFPWSTGERREMSETQRAWLAQERALGVGAGLAVPVQDYAAGPAYLSFYGVEEETAIRLMEERAPELAFVGAQFHALAKTLLPVAGTGHQALLTQREIDCLRLAALGWTISQSSKELGVAHETVVFHLRKVSRKFGTNSKLRAVALAVSAGLIHI